MPELSFAGVIGAVVGAGVGILDYGVVAGLLRRQLARRKETVDPVRIDLLMKGLFVVNTLVFAALGWWVGVSMSGIGVD